MSSTMLISIQAAKNIAILMTSSNKAAVDDVQAYAERQFTELPQMFVDHLIVKLSQLDGCRLGQ